MARRASLRAAEAISARAPNERDHQRQPGIARRPLHGLLQPRDQIRSERGVVADQIEAHPLLLERLQLALEIEAH